MRGGKKAGRGQSSRPWLEVLEDRVTPTILPTGFSESLIKDNIGSVSAMAVAPDGRVFITTQSGDVQVLKNGVLLPNPFFHFNDVDSSGERGVLGIAFDPNFNSNQFIYIYHTVAGSPAHNELSRLTANGDVAAAGSKVDILQLDNLSSATNHNGGATHFGADGKLYIGVGENANPANSQTLANLLGKVLRIDVSTFLPTDPVNSLKVIPSDNPFTPGHATVASGINQAIYGLGFRNPFTFAVDSVSGAIFVNDVGENTWEEIDRLVAGGNYGWGLAEGFFNGTPAGLGPGTYQNPIMAYNHNNATPTTITGIAIVGAAFYEPPARATNPFPTNYTGKYFFSDLVGGFNHDHSQNLGSWIRLFDPTNPGTLFNPDTSQDFASQAAGSNVDIAVAPDGGLYYLSRNGNGQLLKISFIAAPQPLAITQQPTNQAVAQGGSATFTVAASGSGPLSYQWQRNNGPSGGFIDINGATSASFTISSVQSSDNGAQFRVIVSNSSGSVTSNTAMLTVTGTSNGPPTGTITITSGLRNGNFDAGTPIAFTLSATDPQDGTEPASRFTYQVVFVTSLNSTPGGVVQPFVGATSGVASASFTPAAYQPYTLTDVLYRILFTVTDSSGLSATFTKDLAPNTVLLTVQTNPSGLQVLVDAQPTTAPTSFASVVGFFVGLNAPASQTLAGTTYNFVSWSDGGTAQHHIMTPATNQTFTASYAAVGLPTLSAPSNLSAVAVSSSQINVTWTDNSNNETGFELQRATDSGFTQNVVTITLGANSTSTQATGLASGTNYFFRIRAVNGSVSSAYSNTASAMTSAGTPTTIRLEAETFSLNTYIIETGNPSASGNAYIDLRGSGAVVPQIGTATRTFPGATGLYDIVAAVYDQNNGTAGMRFSIAGIQVAAFHLILNLPSSNPDAVSHTTRDLGLFTIANGATIQLGGTSNGGEYAAWDYVDFIPVPPPAPVRPPRGANRPVVTEPQGFDPSASLASTVSIAPTETSGFHTMITPLNTGNDTAKSIAGPRLESRRVFPRTAIRHVWLGGSIPLQMYHLFATIEASEAAKGDF